MVHVIQACLKQAFVSAIVSAQVLRRYLEPWQVLDSEVRGFPSRKAVGAVIQSTAWTQDTLPLFQHLPDEKLLRLCQHLQLLPTVHQGQCILASETL